MRHIFLLAAFLLFLTGCSKDIEEYNKPAAYWYKRMIESVSEGNLDKADNYYSSLQSEHIGSPLLPEATMIMAQSHLQYEEYLLAEHFLNEYIKRYATPGELEYSEYLKIKAKYMALPNPRRDQGLINEAIASGAKFKTIYPNSIYYPIVDTMVTRLVLARASLNESIAELYERLDKPMGAEHYRNVRRENWVDWEDVEKANVAWYKEVFEGDGTESWYAFMIPDTQSVVSRNSQGQVKTADKRSKKEQEEEYQRALNPAGSGF
ncbi:MAG: outer membrane protein assembly factor BamD [Campylobacterota bacterium]